MLLGTIELGGNSNQGTGFAIPRSSHTIGTLASITNSQISAATSGMVVVRHRDVFGTTSNGGADNLGAVVEMAPELGHGDHPGLVRFHEWRDTGRGLVRDPRGDLTGTTAGDDPNIHGVVFELEPDHRK